MYFVLGNFKKNIPASDLEIEATSSLSNDNPFFQVETMYEILLANYFFHDRRDSILYSPTILIQSH